MHYLSSQKNDISIASMVLVQGTPRTSKQEARGKRQAADPSAQVPPQRGGEEQVRGEEWEREAASCPDSAAWCCALNQTPARPWSLPLRRVRPPLGCGGPAHADGTNKVESVWSRVCVHKYKYMAGSGCVLLLQTGCPSPSGTNTPPGCCTGLPAPH